jgi:hypothetical protein
VRAARGQALGELTAGLRADGAHVHIDLSRSYACEQAVRAGRDRFERLVVGDHAEHDVGRRCHLARRTDPGQAALDQRLGLRRGAVGRGHRMTGVEQATGDPAAHRPQADEPDPGPRFRRDDSSRVS